MVGLGPEENDLVSALVNHPLGECGIAEGIAHALGEGWLILGLAEGRPHRPTRRAGCERVALRPVMANERDRPPCASLGSAPR